MDKARETHLRNIVSHSTKMEDAGGSMLICLGLAICLIWFGNDITEDGGSAGTTCSTLGMILLIPALAFGIQFLWLATIKGAGVFSFQNNKAKAQNELNIYYYKKDQERKINAAEKRKQWLENANITYLLKELDKHTESLRQSHSTKSERIVIGHQKVSEGTVFEHTVPQFATRTRDVPEHRVEKMVIDSLPNDIELEIIRRGAKVLDDLIGKYRSRDNLEITKRILKKLPPEEVGKKFEEYEMLEEAEKWYASNKLFNDVKRLKEKMRAKVDQTVVHGDYVDDRDTIVKDSVISKSSIGAGGDDKFARLEKLTEMKEKGLIDDEEFKQMKKEILGK